MSDRKLWTFTKSSQCARDVGTSVQHLPLRHSTKSVSKWWVLHDRIVYSLHRNWNEYWGGVSRRKNSCCHFGVLCRLFLVDPELVREARFRSQHHCLIVGWLASSKILKVKWTAQTWYSRVRRILLRPQTGTLMFSLTTMWKHSARASYWM
jgi:hypothetical protein